MGERFQVNQIYRFKGIIKDTNRLQQRRMNGQIDGESIETNLMGSGWRT
jgi:hypothetical protein